MITDYLLQVLVALTGIHLFYYLFFFFRLAIYKPKALTQQLPPVSVIVCAHDEEQNLQELIPLLLQQTHDQFELIVVNDRSNDGTYDIIREYDSQHAHFKAVQIDHVPDHIQGKKFGLTMGIKAANYEHLLLTDADCRPSSSHWISTMVSKHTDRSQIVLGYSPYYKKPGLLNLFIRWETFMTAVQYLSFSLSGMPYMGVGRNLSYRKSLFLTNKGFSAHQHLTGGDDDLFVNQHANRQNTHIATGRDSLVYSRPKENIKDYFRQKKRHLHVGKYYRAKHRFLLGLLALSHILFWIAFTILAIGGQQALWVYALLGLRWVTMISILYPAGLKLGEESKPWEWLIGDLLLLPYYIIAGIVALVSKKVQWN